ncbi:MAG TPA: Rap1a/Tai family immunity protein [Vitreimonas sp.]|nr:Rap1a/Tai family immunity protein [Vitreimonas sp.]
MPTVKTRALLFIAALAAIPLAMSARAATTENFMVRTTADYVALCESRQGSENYVAAVHFCQGFASGAYQYYLALAQHQPSSRFVCPPDPAPSRDQVIANFLAWSRTHQERMSEPAVESLFRYLGETYPCSDAQRAPQ